MAETRPGYASKNDLHRVSRPQYGQYPSRWTYGPVLMRHFEYSVRQEPYDPSGAGVDGFEQGYHIPHPTDHAWPANSNLAATIMHRLNGPILNEDGSMGRLGALMREAGRL